MIPYLLDEGEAESMTLLHIPSHQILYASDLVQHQMIPFLVEGHSCDWLGQLDFAIETFLMLERFIRTRTKWFT